MNNTLVTVLIPSYNHQKYIKDAILSVINQTYKNIELIVIDDGSSDDSPQIIRSLGKKYNFKYIIRENRGICATLNEALNMAKGVYFCGLGSDDMFFPEKIEKLVNFMLNNPEYAMCYSKVQLFNEKGYFELKAKKNYKSGYIFKDLILENFIEAPTALIKTDVLKEVGGYDESLKYEDYDMWLRIAYKYPIGFINEKLVYYRKHDNNLSNDFWTFYKTNINVIKKWEHIEDVKKVIEQKKLNLFYELVKNGYYDEAKKYQKLAINNIFYKKTFKGLYKLYFNLFKNILKGRNEN